MVPKDVLSFVILTTMTRQQMADLQHVSAVNLKHNHLNIYRWNPACMLHTSLDLERSLES